jgi:hypothetical protein
MRNDYPCVVLSALLLVSLVPAGFALSQVKPGNRLGTVTSDPPIIYVTDFYLDSGPVKSHAILSRRRGTVSGFEKPRGEDPESKAQTVIRALAESIVYDLNKARLRAEYRPNRYEVRTDLYPPVVTAPQEGWLLGGWFVQVDEDSRARQPAVGFGSGAGKSEVVVEVFDLAKNKREPFLLFGSDSDVKIRPSGPVSKQPHVIAIRYVLSDRHTEDVGIVGSQIARNLIDFINSSTGK